MPWLYLDFTTGLTRTEFLTGSVYKESFFNDKKVLQYTHYENEIYFSSNFDAFLRCFTL